MVSRLILPLALIAGVTSFAIMDRHFRHKEVLARTIAYGATRRALEQSALGTWETGRAIPPDSVAR